CWVIAQGNRHDLREFADTMEPFDAAMADIYAARSGQELADVQRQMDGETWIGGSQAIDQGYADELLPSDQVGKSDTKASASAVRLAAVGVMPPDAACTMRPHSAPQPPWRHPSPRY